MGVEETVRSRAPRPLLSRTDEARLGARHREVLDGLENLFMENGFVSFTIADLAKEIGCSRRTLYELAPSKDQLVLIVLDRRLHRMGRAALGSIVPTAPLLDQVRQYSKIVRKLWISVLPEKLVTLAKLNCDELGQLGLQRRQ